MTENVTMSKKTYNELMTYIGKQPLEKVLGLFTRVTSEVRTNEAKALAETSAKTPPAIPTKPKIKKVEKDN